MVGGHLVPTVRGKVQFMANKPRRISLQVHGPAAMATTGSASGSASASASGSASTIESSSLSSSPIKKNLMQSLLQGKAPETDLELQVLQDHESAYLRVLKETKDHNNNNTTTTAAAAGKRARDDSSTGSSIQDKVSALGILAPGDDNSQQWTERGCYKLEDVTILKTTGRTCEVKFGSANEVIVRDIKFESEKDRISFQKVMAAMAALVRERAQRQAQAYKTQKKTTAGTAIPSAQLSYQTRALPGLEEGNEVAENINLLVEIVSAMNIPAADLFSSSDAYVIVRMAGKEVHRTSIVPKSLDPIWTLRKKSLFLLQMTPEQFFSCSGGMSFTMEDYDSVSSNELLGRVTVTLEELLKGTGERTGYDIIPDEPGQKGKTHGKLYLRYKEATPEDIEVRLLSPDCCCCCWRCCCCY